MNRTDFQRLADERLEDARILLGARRFSGAYYLAGYAVECALKSCIAKQIREHDFPDLSFIRDSYTHDLKKLLALSGEKPALEIDSSQDKVFESSWSVVERWSEKSRNGGAVTEIDARDLFTAIGHSHAGILPWLKTRW